jgi:hypothetical protein
MPCSRRASPASLRASRCRSVIARRRSGSGLPFASRNNPSPAQPLRSIASGCRRNNPSLQLHRCLERRGIAGEELTAADVAEIARRTSTERDKSNDEGNVLAASVAGRGDGELLKSKLELGAVLVGSDRGAGDGLNILPLLPEGVGALGCAC